MKSPEHIENVLERLGREWPEDCSIVESVVRQIELMPAVTTLAQRKESMGASLLNRMSTMMKLAAVVLVAAVLVGTGWTAEKIYKMVSSEHAVILHRGPSGRTTEFGTNSANPAKEEKRADKEIRQLVAQKKYKFVRTIDLPRGDKLNVYYFYLSDGTRVKWKNYPPRLEDVASLDEYEQKSAEYSATPERHWKGIRQRKSPPHQYHRHGNPCMPRRGI